MIFQLHPVIDDIKSKPLWCGYAALSSILNKPVSWCEAEIKKLQPDCTNCGVMWEVLSAICAKEGIFFFDHSYRGPLGAMPTEHLTLNVISPGAGHYVVVQRGLLVDCKFVQPTHISRTGYGDSIVRWGFVLLTRGEGQRLFV